MSKFVKIDHKTIKISKPFDTNEFIVCYECYLNNEKNYTFKQLNKSHFSKHNLTTEEYKEKYCDPKVSSPNSIDKMLSKKDYTNEEYNKTASPYCIEYYNKRNPELTQGERDELLKQYMNKVNSKEATINRGGDTERNSPYNIKFYELRYPELTEDERIDMLNEAKQKAKDNKTDDKDNTKAEYYMRKYNVTRDIAEIMLSARQNTTSLQSFIESYGSIEEGTRRYEQRLLNFANSMKNNKNLNLGRSAISLHLFDSIQDRFTNRQFDYEIELVIKHYRVDFTCTKTKRVIEFNGDYFHGNPKLYTENCIYKNKQVPYSELWNRDIKKINDVINEGYEVLVIWESEYSTRSKPEQKEIIINRCINFLNGNYKEDPFSVYPEKYRN